MQEGEKMACYHSLDRHGIVIRCCVLTFFFFFFLQFHSFCGRSKNPLVLFQSFIQRYNKSYVHLQFTFGPTVLQYELPIVRFLTAENDACAEFDT